MARVVKTYTFDAAHQLVGHKGKCARAHGHTYRVEVTVAGPVRPVFPAEEYSWAGLASSGGMVLDFDDIDSVMRPLLRDYLDHHNLNETLVGCPRTTAELIGCWVLGSFMKTAPQVFLGSDAHPILNVTVWETPNCRAEIGIADWDDNGRLGVEVEIPVGVVASWGESHVSQ